MVDDGSCVLKGCTDSRAASPPPPGPPPSMPPSLPPGAPPAPPTGCMNPKALNYVPGAVVAAEGCITPGCTDSKAPQYDAAATYDDGSCTFTKIKGCTDSFAANFRKRATVCTRAAHPDCPRARRYY